MKNIKWTEEEIKEFEDALAKELHPWDRGWLEDTTAFNTLIAPDEKSYNLMQIAVESTAEIISKWPPEKLEEYKRVTLKFRRDWIASLREGSEPPKLPVMYPKTS